MYEWNSEWEDGQTRAVCSKCGIPYRWPSEIVKLDDGFFYCLRRCKEQTVKARDKIISQSRKRREMPPPKFVQAPRYAEDYFDGEDAQFTAALALVSSTDATSIGWAVNYLADIVIEAKRPERWLVDARRVIKACCDTLLTLQYGAPTGPVPSLTVERLRYGGFATGNLLYSSSATIAGVALLKGYQILGTVKYLDAASRCAHFLRHMQCQDLDTTGQATTYGGSPYHIGGFAESVSTSGTITWTSHYNISCVAGAWFLTLLAGVQGSATVYGGIAGADFTASTAATLAVMIAESVAFVTAGAKDIQFAGALTTGLSTTYPRSFYTSADSLSTWGLTPALGSPSQIMLGSDVALALFALNYVGTAPAQVTAVFDWLMTFTANPLNAAADEDAQLLIGNLKGTYNPKMAIASGLDVLAADGVTPVTTEHVGAGYSWAATGLLAPIACLRQPVEFEASKAQLSILQPSQAGPNPVYASMNATGYSGLSFQIVSPAVATSLATTGTSLTSSSSGVSSSPPAGGIFWFKADAGVTLDGSGRVLTWADQSGNGYDLNAPAGVLHRPLWTDRAINNSLPALDWGACIVNDSATYKALSRDLTPDGGPIRNLAGRTVLAIIRPGPSADSSRVGGNVVSLGSVAGDFTPQMCQIVGVQEGMYDGLGRFWQLNSVVNYNGVTIVGDWAWNGIFSPGVAVNVNGVSRPGQIQPTSPYFSTNNGVHHLDIGYENSDAYTGLTFSGMIAEVICYAGTDPATIVAARAYLMARAGVSTTALPGVMGTLYRSTPAAYGDRFFNPGQP